ncbi:hypothetical protein O6U65_0832 [Saccharomyces cerevisiae synthetic construct]|uniref:Putative uncharacterized protein YER087C-A n=1 Tax=Saccharomyces cerevisiae (strain ATCC 204508 / S288c) TaxID=559292 RepID=YE087_YEAST|nr:RecName: Full=Putative uncharacterized protein YER087C-A; Flags: Precursor [Saccharomyces cerevisiae S288C]AHX39278.1 hypothetical protein YER087C-A [Saccharomyces cerevisiae]WNV72517.1 hypothetical protein O6U65_0832 [Saccharomyces cerevisiae synthetic construct]
MVLFILVLYTCIQDGNGLLCGYISFSNTPMTSAKCWIGTVCFSIPCSFLVHFHCSSLHLFSNCFLHRSFSPHLMPRTSISTLGQLFEPTITHNGIPMACDNFILAPIPSFSLNWSRMSFCKFCMVGSFSSSDLTSCNLCEFSGLFGPVQIDTLYGAIIAGHLNPLESRPSSAIAPTSLLTPMP